MLFNSTSFLIFLPVVLIVYFIIPDKIKYLWLLVASYYFYMCWNIKYVFLIFLSTVITYASGLLLEKINCANDSEIRKVKEKKLVVAGSLLINLGILFYFKYANFTFNLVAKGLEVISIQYKAPAIDMILPVGISFYTFQALSYTMDIYRGELYAEKNFFRYALFVSFFPQLVAGPIERSKNLLKQLAVPSRFSFENAREGVLLMLWGYFLKVVLADRIAIFVDSIYGNYANYDGYYLIVATIFFAVQIYCDFAGYSIIAMGSAKMLNIQLMENFDAPYLAVSVAEFWRRWHISLTTWFKDYLYIPLGGSRKGKIRKYINKMIVFLVSGLWHGASISFVVWGGMNGLYQIVGEVLQPFRDRWVKILNLDRNSIAHRLLNTVTTFMLVDFTWIFFRASRLKDAIHIIKRIIEAKQPWILFDGSLYSCGLDSKNFWLMIICICVLLVADNIKLSGIKIRKIIVKQDGWAQILVVSFSILVILIFGIYGTGYDEAAFIYFQF